ncbi:MAG TPA: hypothetical protein VEC57_07565 [Candidatus Limnocylindrales bacterium]|nr:hypothetical protein [Candidatus Limnocylindrales bacterium]
MTVHINSGKHIAAKEKLAAKAPREAEIADALSHHKAMTERKRRRTIFRFRVVKTFISAGIALNKVRGAVRELLEEGGERLTDRSHLAALIPDILQNEWRKVTADVSGGFVSIIFDGSCVSAEAYVIILRFIDALSLRVQQRIVNLRLLAKSVDQDDLARVLSETLSLVLRLEPGRVAAFIHDAANVNGAAYNVLKPLYTASASIDCLSHACDNVGKKAVYGVLDDFFSDFNHVMVTSPKARMLWRDLIGVFVKRQVCANA